MDWSFLSFMSNDYRNKVRVLITTEYQGRYLDILSPNGQWQWKPFIPDIMDNHDWHFDTEAGFRETVAQTINTEIYTLFIFEL